MKLLSLILMMVIFSIGQGFSQEQPDKVVAYKTWVTTQSGAELRGLLFYANTEEIVVTDGFKSKNKKLVNIPYQDIVLVKLQRRGVKTEGAIIGGVLGAGLAFLLTKDIKGSNSWIFGDLFRDTIVLGYVVGFTLEGATIGAKLSDKKAQFYINGNELAYKNQLNKLKEYCLIREQSTLELEQEKL